MQNSQLESQILKFFQKSVLAFPANMPISILIIKGQLKININPETRGFLSLKYIDIYQIII